MNASKLKGKKVLVTGASGFVGTNALLRLAEIEDCQVAAADVSPLKVKAKNIAFLKTDLMDMEQCKKAVKGADYVLMLASRVNRRGKDMSYLKSNIMMNFNTLEAAYNSGVKKCVLLGSATGYPSADVPLREDEMFLRDPADENFGVGWAARYIEKLAQMYSAKLERNMPVIVLRATAIYGPYCDFNLDTCHVLPALIRKVAERHSPIEMWGDGRTKRDFVYVDDVIASALYSLQNIKERDAFNIASGSPVSVKDLLSLILEAEKYGNAKINFNLSKQLKTQPIVIERSKADRAMGIPPTPLKEGIRKTLDWFKANEMLGGKV